MPDDYHRHVIMDEARLASVFFHGNPLVLVYAPQGVSPIIPKVYPQGIHRKKCKMGYLSIVESQKLTKRTLQKGVERFNFPDLDFGARACFGAGVFSNRFHRDKKVNVGKYTCSMDPRL